MMFTSEILQRCASAEHILILNSAQSAVLQTILRSTHAAVTLLEDRIDTAQKVLADAQTLNHNGAIQHIPFHKATQKTVSLHADIAYLNMQYQPSTAWSIHAIRIAQRELQPGGILLIEGANNAGVRSFAKRVESVLGNIQILEIRHGHRLIQATRTAREIETNTYATDLNWALFAKGVLDEGTRLLLEVLQVQPHENALDIGCGAGYIGIHIAKHIRAGTVTMTDISLAAVEASTQATRNAKLQNIRVLAGNGIEPVLKETFTLIAMNPPFHSGRIQSPTIGMRLLQDASRVLESAGKIYFVANRMLPYKRVLPECYKDIQEVHGNSRYMVITAKRK